MDTALVCRINPVCKRLQAGIICPHMQSVPAQGFRIQPPQVLPPLRRVTRLPPVSPVLLPPPPPTPLLLPIRPIPQKTLSTPIHFTPPSPQTTLVPTNSSSFRPILIRQRLTY